MIKLQKWLILLLWLVFLLGNAACLGRQVAQDGASPAAGLDSRNTVAPLESDTNEYINDWTFPDTEPDSSVSGSAISEESRERMVTDDTDEYIRAWTFPTTADEAPKKPSAAVKPHKVQPQIPPVGNTEEFIDGWTL